MAMSSTAAKHPSDRVMVSAVDQQLSAGRTAVLHAHLRQCDSCRARFAALSGLRDDITRAFREDRGRPGAPSSLRNRLRTQMAARSAIWNRSQWFRVRRALRGFPFALRTAVATGALIVIGQTMWLSYTTRRASTG